ncbi:MAG: hypothetical protein Q8O99_01755 [bacterium]|nr:hypothetical protein [bacterium]
MQIAFDLDDERAMNKRNMGLSYAITCRRKEAGEIIELARKQGLTANVIGKILPKDGINTDHYITGVGRGASDFTFGEK